MVEILGPNGEPIRNPAPVREDQSSRLGALHREIAEHPTRGLTPDRLARLYIEAEQGDLRAQADLADDMQEKDAHLFAELSKRTLAIASTDFSVEPPRDATPMEERNAAIISDVIDELDMQDLLQDMCTAILHSYAAIEYHWRLVDGVWIQSTPEMRPHNWFCIKPDAQNNLLLRNSAGGEPLRAINWTLHRHKARSGYIARAGLVRVLGWPFLMRALSTRDLAEFLEIYGLPLRLGKYNSNATDKEKSRLLSAVVGIGHAAAGIIPESMQIDFKEAAKGGAAPFMAMMQWAEGSISKAILGGTLTTTAAPTGLGSNLGDVQNEVRKEICDSDLRQLKRTLEQQTIAQIHALNGMTGRPPLWVWQTEDSEDINDFGDGLLKLIDAGMQIPSSWAHDRTRIPRAKAGDTVLRRATQPDLQPGIAPNSLQPIGPEQQLIRNPAGVHIDQLQKNAADPLRAWLQQIRDMAANASSLEELRDRIIASYGDLPSEQMRNVMAMAFGAAQAAGRADVLDESDVD